MSNEMLGRVVHSLRQMNPRERKVFFMRNGITKNNVSYTLQEIGDVFGVTRERIRQIEEKALQRMSFTIQRGA